MPLGSNSILVVDDSVDDQFLTQRVLETAGFCSPFHVCGSGSDAMQLLQNGTAADIRLVLLDIRMPMMDGFELLNWIRRQPHLSHLRVVMHSTSEVPEDVDRARELGADGYIAKETRPEKFAALLEAIDRSLVPSSVSAR
jgi:CheY-like chemotaxis protein